MLFQNENEDALLALANEGVTARQVAREDFLIWVLDREVVQENPPTFDESSHVALRARESPFYQYF